MSSHAPSAETVVECPECHSRFLLSKALTGPIEAQIARRLEEGFQQREQQRARDFEQRVSQEAAKAAEKVAKAHVIEISALEEQVAEQRSTLCKMQEQELLLRKHTRELETRESEMMLQIERQVDERTKTIEDETRARLAEHHRLKELEKDKQLADLRHQLEEATRRAQLGSQQLQGYVAESDIDLQLRRAFPQDSIDGVSTGQRGADIVQKVVNAAGGTCGAILYEVKNTKSFSEGWLPKLRDDQRSLGAEVAVLVTTTLPKDVSTFAQRDGVWVTGTATWLPLAYALRAGLVEAARARVVANGQSEKQASLLAYCGGTEFRQRVEALIEALLALIDDLNKERRGIEASWARRAKNHERLLRAIAGMYGDVGGIIGTLPQITRLELGPPGDEKSA